MSNGKGDSPRNNFSRQFRQNFDRINWGRPQTLEESCGAIRGSFRRHLRETQEEERRLEQERKDRIRKFGIGKKKS